MWRGNSKNWCANWRIQRSHDHSRQGAGGDSRGDAMVQMAYSRPILGRPSKNGPCASNAGKNLRPPRLPSRSAKGAQVSASNLDGNAEKRLTFDEWWLGYCMENGFKNKSSKSKDAARAAWAACAVQDIPAYALFALAAAHRHTSELRDAWRRGIIDERDGGGGTRSNRNVDVEVGTRRALELIQPRVTLQMPIAATAR